MKKAEWGRGGGGNGGNSATVYAAMLFCISTIKDTREYSNPNDLSYSSRWYIIFLKMTVDLKKMHRLCWYWKLSALITYSYRLQVQLQGHREGKQTKESANTDPSKKNKQKKPQVLGILMKSPSWIAYVDILKGKKLRFAGDQRVATNKWKLMCSLFAYFPHPQGESSTVTPSSTGGPFDNDWSNHRAHLQKATC